MWVVSKNESNCLLENKMVSTLIWRNVILLYVVKSNILWLTFKLSYHYRCNILCTVSFLLYIATKKLKQNLYCKQFYECSYHKKITLARFASLCFSFANSICSTVSGPKALKNMSAFCHTQLQWKVMKCF